jgi:mono/diheme cytochrome c family protein
MRFGRKAGRIYFTGFFLGAGLLVAGGARIRAVPASQTPSSAATEAEVAKGRKVFGESCIQCHNMNAVLIQRKPAQGWRETVYSMISRGAQLTPDEIDPLIAYLTATYGPDSPPPSRPKSVSGMPAGEESLPAGAGKQIVLRACVKCHNLGVVTASRKSEAEWTETVARMVSFGAAVRSPDRQTLVQYLAKNFGGGK